MGSKFVIYVALAADLGIAITKFIAASVTGSVAMLSEGIHSVIDCLNQLLLLLGISRSKKRADSQRPFGYGKELYFWSFIVSLLFFSFGGCISFYEGIIRIRHPRFEADQSWNYFVLAVAFVFTAISLFVTLRNFNRNRGELGFWEAITKSKDPAVFIVLIGDLGDIAGLTIAFLGVHLGHKYHNPYFDGVASIIIGIVLILLSLLLLRECRSLLMGESAGKKMIEAIIAITESDATVMKVKKHFSMYMAPDEIVLQLQAVFKNGLNTGEITTAIQRIKENIQKEFPQVKQIFIEPE